jgi:hypothetical protein
MLWTLPEPPNVYNAPQRFIGDYSKKDSCYSQSADKDKTGSSRNDKEDTEKLCKHHPFCVSVTAYSCTEDDIA